MKNKRAQEEIVGFIAIIMLIAVVAVILLGISLRSDTTITRESNDLSKFIDSAMVYTTECAFYEPNYRSLKDVMSECYSFPSKKCFDGNGVCFVLNKTLMGVLDAGWPTAGKEGSSVRGYVFESYFSVNFSSAEKNKIISVERGNCTARAYAEGDDFFSSNRGVISSTLRVCYS